MLFCTIWKRNGIKNCLFLMEEKIAFDLAFKNVLVVSQNNFFVFSLQLVYWKTFGIG